MMTMIIYMFMASIIFVPLGLCHLKQLPDLLIIFNMRWLMIPILGAALSAIPNVISSVGSTIGGIFGANNQYSHDLNMWNKANAYNSPAAQMQRLKDAGLNPNMVYGTGSVTGNTSTATPQYHAPSYNLELPDMVSKYQAIRQQNADVDVATQNLANLKATEANTQAQTTKLEADTAISRAQALSETLRQAGMLTANAKSKLDLDIANDLRSNTMAVARQNLSNLSAQGNVLQSNARLNAANTAVANINKAGAIIANKRAGIQYGFEKEGITGNGTGSTVAKFLLQQAKKMQTRTLPAYKGAVPPRISQPRYNISPDYHSF